MQIEAKTNVVWHKMLFIPESWAPSNPLVGGELQPPYLATDSQ